MSRKFITIILSAAIAVTGFTAPPARAGDDDIAKWIAGAAALAIIGAAINEKNNNNNNRSRPRYNNGYGYNGYGYNNDYNHNNGHSHGNGHKKGHKKGDDHDEGHGQNYGNQGHSGNVISPRPNPLVLPARCRVERNLNGNSIRGFSRGCLNRSNVNVNALPRDCAVKFRDRKSNRPVVIYGGRCLRGYGYRVARG